MCFVCVCVCVRVLFVHVCMDMVYFIELCQHQTVAFPDIQVNPFRYRLTKIFCSSEQGFMDFDDFLDLVAIMSDHAS